MDRQKAVDGVVKALRSVNFRGSAFGQTVAIRIGLSELDVEALEMLVDTGAATAGRLAELMGLTTGAVTRMIDRLEQAGYVRRVPDPADRRRVIVEPVPERLAAVEPLLESVAAATAREMADYSPDQLELIGDFLQRVADATRAETERLRDTSPEPGEGSAGGEHSAPLGGLSAARLLFRAGAPDVALHVDPRLNVLYRARFEGGVPTVRLREGTVTVHYRGFNWGLGLSKRAADLALNPAIPWEIALHGGAHRLSGDLGGLPLRSLELTGGVGTVELDLGRPNGVVRLRIAGGASEIRLRRPAGVPLSLRVAGGSGRIDFDGQRLGGVGGETVLESAGASQAADRFVVELVGGVGRVSVGPRTRG